MRGGTIATLAADLRLPAVASETHAFGFTAADELVAVPLDGGAQASLAALSRL